LWYLGARFPMRTRRPPNVGGAARQRRPRSTRRKSPTTRRRHQRDQIGARPHVRRREAAVGDGPARGFAKVEVMLTFFNRIGFAINQAGVVDGGAHFVMYSERGSHAFRFLKEGAKIVYGKLDLKTLEWTWTLL
jgi:hypothetical protein